MARRIYIVELAVETTDTPRDPVLPDNDTFDGHLWEALKGTQLGRGSIKAEHLGIYVDEIEVIGTREG